MPYGNCGDYYGRGDYYRGDYYRGDFFGKLLKGVGGAIGGLVTGGPLGAIRGGIQAIVGTGVPKSVQLPSQALALQRPGPFIGAQARLPSGGGVSAGFGMPAPFFPEGQGQIPPGVSLTPSGALVPCQLPGYRPNKSSYYRRVGGPGSVSGILVPKGSVCVKRRSMNPTNGRALKRALTRAYAFKKIAMRTLRLLSPTKPKRFGGFKKRGK